MLDPNGTAVVMSSANVNELEEYLHFLSSELNINLFEIVPVQFPTCKEQTTALTSIEKPMSPHVNKNHSNETDKQIRLENARQCMERKRSVETELEKQIRLKIARQYHNSKRLVETELEKQNRLENSRHCSGK